MPFLTKTTKGHTSPSAPMTEQSEQYFDFVSDTDAAPPPPPCSK